MGSIVPLHTGSTDEPAPTRNSMTTHAIGVAHNAEHYCGSIKSRVVPCVPMRFALLTMRGNQLARMQSAAQDRIDLLSAVMHELGHALGREHEDGGVMADVLRPGVRTVVDEMSPTLAP